MDFADKVVLVTGASSGIGAATALLFAKYGAQLSLAGRNESALEEVASDCGRFHGKEPLKTIGDLTDDEYVSLLISETTSKLGKLDVLVNNAGTLDIGSIENPEVMNQFDRLFSVNVRPTLLLISLAVPYLTETRGSIVNVSSIAGNRSLPGILAYSLSKSCVDQMTRCIAMELASKQVRVNCVNPGTIATQIQSRAGVDPRPYYEKAKLTHPLGRIGKPDEVAAVIVFLASEMASFMTGVCVPVDGGRHCTTPSTIGGSATTSQKGAGEGQEDEVQEEDEFTEGDMTENLTEATVQSAVGSTMDTTAESLEDKTEIDLTAEQSQKSLEEKPSENITDKTEEGKSEEK